MNRRSGYSILEVLIAFAVMSITLAVLLPGQMQLMGRAGTAAERALAHDLALSRIDTIKMLGSEGGQDRFDNWRITEGATDIPGARRITVSITAENGQTLAEVTRTFGVPDAE